MERRDHCRDGIHLAPVLPPKPGGDLLEFRARGRDRDAVGKPSYRHPVVRLPDLAHEGVDRDPEVGVPGIPEAGRHDSDHLPRLAPYLNREGSQVSIGTELVAPESFAYDDAASSAGSEFLRQERAPQHWPDAQGIEKIGRDGRTQCPGRLLSPEHGRRAVEVQARVHRHRLEAPALLAPVEEVRRGDMHLLPVLVQFPDADDSIRFGVGERFEQNRIHHAEDRAVRPDSQRERENRDGGEPGIPGERATGVAQILPERSHGGAYSSRSEVMGSVRAARRAGK